jgi:hypothetical protein
MLERFLKLRINVNSVINSSATQRYKCQKYILTNEEVQLAEHMIVVLQPFKVMTKMVSQSSLTNSRIIPFLVFLRKKLQPENIEKIELKKMKAFMLVCLDYYIEKYKMFNNVVLISATYLDPELKSFDFVQDFADKTADDFLLIAHNFLKSKNKEINPNDVEHVNSTINTLVEPSVSSKTNLSLEDEIFTFLKGNKNPESKKKGELTIEDEMRLYNSLKITKSDFSQFWSNNSIKLPKLSKIVKCICCGPPATTPSERDFSMGTDIITPKRNRLSEKKIEYLSFLKRNLDREFD